MAIDPVRLKQLFQGAVEIADRQQREAWLTEACSTDTEMFARLKALLIARDDPASFLDRLAPPDSSNTDETGAFTPNQEAANSVPLPNTQEKPGHVVGRYKLLECIGEGGMGSVWMAEQREPVKRLVALKLIKAGMDSQAVLTRFEAERQALALMDHPNIAKVLDGGTTESGRPFFVMELVKGLPLTEYCDSRKLNLKDRLQLFIQICSAVQHAHQKGIIHRDLKPSNVLVTEHDGQPVPKVIDFGLAKALNATNMLTDRTLHTAYGTVVGTPLYMAPEQVGINALDTDTRSDVYALGVMLYELLTGTTPLEKQRFKEAAWDEVKRIIQEEEPPRPSMRLSSSDTLPSLAANRQVEPAKLSNLIKGELDWIVMKALEKDRNRRYETANGFSRDIQRYLADEMVEARPPSTGYRLRKFVQRNKGKVIAAGIMLGLLLAGIAGTTIGLIEAKKQERLAVAAASEEHKAKQREADRADSEKKAKEDAVRNLAFARKGYEILGSVFAGLDPKKIAESGRPLQDVLRENLVKAVNELDGSAIGNPLDVAAMQYTLGRSLQALGEYGLAIKLTLKMRDTLKSKLGPDHPDTLACMNSLALAYQEDGKPDLALPIFEENLKLFKAKLGSDHLSTLTCMGNLAGAYHAVGKWYLALPLYEETLKLQKVKLGPEHPVTIHSMGSLALAYKEAGKLELAVPLLKETMKLQKTKLGPEHPDTLNSMHNLAGAYHAAGKIDLALPLLEETLKLKKAKLGPDHPSTLASMNDLAAEYAAARNLDLALPLLVEALKLMKAKLGPEHPSTLASMHNLASGYLAAGKVDLALPLHEETLKLQKAILGPDHPHTLVSMDNLSKAYQQARKLDQALPLFEETLKLKQTKLGPEHPVTLASMNNLAGGYLAAGKIDLALPLFEESLKLFKAMLGPDHPDTLTVMENLAVCYYEVKQFDKADFLLRERLPLVKLKSGVESPAYASALVFLGGNLLQQKKWIEAEPFVREALAIRKKTQSDDWKTFNTYSLLGGSLLGQKKYIEAEPLLLKGYEGMKTREKMIPQIRGSELRIPEALDRLIQLYTETNKPDEVKKWQAEKAKRPVPIPAKP